VPLEEIELSIYEPAPLRLGQPSFRQLFELGPDASVIADGAGRVVTANQLAARIFGYSRDELPGQLVESLLPQRFRASHSEHHDEYVDSAFLRPMGIGEELLGLKKDGTEFPMEISVSAVDTPDGLFVSIAIRDVGERKRSEALRSELGFERLMSDLSRRFINLPSDRVDSELTDALRLVVQACGTDRGVLCEVDLSSETLFITHRWDRQGNSAGKGSDRQEYVPLGLTNGS
jgi:PAS domain S-box-containing protein